LGSPRSWISGASVRGANGSRPGTVALLIRLKRDVYGDFSVRHCYEQITEKHAVKVSYNWLRLMLQEAGVVAKEPARGQYRRRRERRPLSGMLVHLDASTHAWIAGVAQQDLVVALDDADGRILFAQFFAQEGTASTFAALAAVVREDGRFCELYTDRASHFARTEPGAQAPPKSKMVGSAARCARSASARFWPAHPKRGVAASVRSAPFRGACRRNSESRG
jgi:hypothetical protein